MLTSLILTTGSEENDMKYIIEYKETYGGCFDIEADSKEEALDIFYNEFDYYSRKLWCVDSITDVIETK